MNSSPAREFFRACHKNRNFMVGFIMVASVILVALFADVIAPYPFDMAHPQDILKAPCGQYLFGTDNMGRDLFSRIIYGTRIALQVALVGAGLQLVVGTVVGLICGYFGGWIRH